MQELRIGILGGCLAGLGNVGKSELFYNRIKAALKDRVKLTYALSSYSNISEVSEKIRELKERKNIDVLLLQIRPGPYLSACRLILRVPTPQINPLLWRTETETAFDSLKLPPNEVLATMRIMRPYPLRHKYISAKNVNLLLGYLAGVHRKVETYYLDQLLALNAYCASLGISLIVHGPVPRTSLGMAGPIFHSLCNRLARGLSPSVPYVATMGSNGRACNQMLFEDGDHVNAFGHQILAERLLTTITDLIAKRDANA